MILLFSFSSVKNSDKLIKATIKTVNALEQIVEKML